MSRVAFVTGGTRGIGLACAQALAKLGHRVAVTARSEQPDLPDGLVPVACDVTSTADVDRAFSEIESRWGPVEILVANAGIVRDGLLVRMKEDDWNAVVDANLTGAFRVAKRALPSMLKARWGRLVFVSSVGAYVGAAGQANYAASKAGMIGFARSVAREYAPKGITANVVAPGPIDTDMTTALGDARVQQMAAAVPMGRVGHADEVAAAVTFLTSDDAAFITGTVLPVDGGLAMGH